jgi:hypothetical protein
MKHRFTISKKDEKSIDRQFRFAFLLGENQSKFKAFLSAAIGIKSFRLGKVQRGLSLHQLFFVFFVGQFSTTLHQFVLMRIEIAFRLTCPSF